MKICIWKKERKQLEIFFGDHIKEDDIHTKNPIFQSEPN